LLAGRHPRAAHCCVCQGKRHGVARDLDLAAGGLRQQAAQIRRYDIDDILRKRLALANRDAVADGLLDPIFVAPALLGDRARKGRREVFNLLTHRTLNVFSALFDRMSRTDSCSRSHCGYVRRFGDEGAGGGGAGARRRDIHDHRYGGG